MHASSALRGRWFQGVAQEVDVAALPERLQQHLADRPLQPRMVVADHAPTHPRQPELLQPQNSLHNVPLSRFSISTASTWRCPSPSIPITTITTILLSATEWEKKFYGNRFGLTHLSIAFLSSFLCSWNRAG